MRLAPINLDSWYDDDAKLVLRIDHNRIVDWEEIATIIVDKINEIVEEVNND